MVSLQHSHGITRYLHLDRLAYGVQAGVHVTRGQLIGYSGNTGLSFGDHLHLDYYPVDEPKDNGYGGRVDPLPYLPEA